MGVKLPPRVEQFLREPNLAFLATLLPDGSPQVAPVWVDYDGIHILVNTVLGRAKVRNVRRDPRVALALVHWYNPHSCAMVRGKVASITRRDVDAHTDRLVRKYLGLPWNPFRGQEERAILRIEPQKFSTFSAISQWEKLAREWLWKRVPGPRR